MIFSWLRRRRTARARIESDADKLTALWGDDAYFQALDLDWQETNAGEPGRVSSHWLDVALEIWRRADPKPRPRAAAVESLTAADLFARSPDDPPPAPYRSRARRLRSRLRPRRARIVAE